MSPRASFYTGFGAGIATTIVFAVVCLFAAALLLREGFVARKAEALLPPPLQPGTMAEYNWQLLDEKGQTRQFAEFRGKPIVLQFWSPTCPSCEAEIPAMNALFDAVSKAGIEVVAVTADTPAPELSATAARLGVRYPIYTVQGPVPPAFKFTAGPATFIIGPSGMMLFKHIGAAKWDDPQVLLYLTMLTESARAMPGAEAPPPAVVEGEAAAPVTL